jgi:hypothetical protein
MINRLFFFILIITSLFFILSSSFLFNYKSINALNNNSIIQLQQPLTKSLNSATPEATKVIPCIPSSTMQCPFASNSISPSNPFSSLPILTDKNNNNNNNNLSKPVPSISNSITNYSKQIANTLNASSCEQSLIMQCPPPPVLDLKYNNAYSTNNGLQELYLKQQNEMLALLQKQQQEQKDFLQKQFQGVFGNVFSQTLISNTTNPNIDTTTTTTTATINNNTNAFIPLH